MAKARQRLDARRPILKTRCVPRIHTATVYLLGVIHVGKDGIVERLRRQGHPVKWLGPEEYAVPPR